MCIRCQVGTFKFKNQSLFILLCVWCVNTSKSFDIHNARTHYNLTHYQDTDRKSERSYNMENRNSLCFDNENLNAMPPQKMYAWIKRNWNGKLATPTEWPMEINFPARNRAIIGMDHSNFTHENQSVMEVIIYLFNNALFKSNWNCGGSAHYLYNGMDFDCNWFDDLGRLLLVFISYHVSLNEKKRFCAKLNENTLIILMPTRRTQKECLSWTMWI